MKTCMHPPTHMHARTDTDTHTQSIGGGHCRNTFSIQSTHCEQKETGAGSLYIINRPKTKKRLFLDHGVVEGAKNVHDMKRLIQGVFKSGDRFSLTLQNPRET